MLMTRDEVRKEQEHLRSLRTLSREQILRQDKLYRMQKWWAYEEWAQVPVEDRNYILKRVDEAKKRVRRR